MTTYSPDRVQGSLTRLLWQESSDTIGQILQHPFLSGLTDGTLDKDAFIQFIVQDSHYIRVYSQCLALLATRANNVNQSMMFLNHAVGAINAETGLHEVLLADLGVPTSVLQLVAPTPTTFAYTNHLLATCYRGSFLEGFVALLPCYWIYAEVGRALVAFGSPDPLYDKWINNYAGGAYEVMVTEALDEVDALTTDISESEQARLVEIFQSGSRLEWMFWDAAFRNEEWPI